MLTERIVPRHPSNGVFQRSIESGLSSRLINWKRTPVGPPAVCGCIASIRHSRGCLASAGGWAFIQQLVERRAARVRVRRTVFRIRGVYRGRRLRGRNGSGNGSARDSAVPFELLDDLMAELL